MYNNCIMINLMITGWPTQHLIHSNFSPWKGRGSALPPTEYTLGVTPGHVTLDLPWSVKEATSPLAI